MSHTSGTIGNDANSLECDANSAALVSTSSGPASDLFSEIHLNELQKLEKQLESSEADKSQLTLSLKETKENLEKTRGELTSQQVILSRFYINDRENILRAESKKEAWKKMCRFYF